MENTRKSNEGTLDGVLLETDSHDQFLRMLMGSLVSTTKQSNTLPKSGLDYKYNASFAQFRNARDVTSSKSTELIQQLLSYCQPKDGDASTAMQLTVEETDPYFYSQVVDTIDLLLERAERTLSRLDADKFGQEASSIVQQSLLYDKDRIIRENMRNIPKPQDLFLSTIDNRRETLFVPTLTRKFHARVDYKPTVQYTDEDNTQGVYTHPYEYELQRLVYPPYLLKKPKSKEAIMPDRLRPFDLIDTESGLLKLIEDLKSCKEIAVDLEHHSMRSFQGLTCLMQISSRHKDYIVDTLALRLSLWQLGEIFANPKIVKVFHGCENDIYWLQRDFNLYVVNCFDTYVAAKQLRFPALSLAHLVRIYCGVTLDKTHQLSDWRQRPLSEEMLQYARCDTMYLLYVFDMLRRDLWNAVAPTVAEAYQPQSQIAESESGSVDFIEAVLAGSKRLCLNVYQKPVFDSEGYKALVALDSKLIRATNGMKDLTPLQTRVIAGLWDWRDNQARLEDESVLYILSNAELMRTGLLAPRTVQELRDKILSQALAILTPYALDHLEDIAQVIQRALSTYTNEPMSSDAPLSIAAASTALSTTAASVSSSKRTASAAPVIPTIMSFTPSISANTNTALPTNPALSVLTNNTASHNSNNSSSIGANTAAVVAQSPVLPLDEMFRRAGWKSPMLFPAQQNQSRAATTTTSRRFSHGAHSDDGGEDMTADMDHAHMQVDDDEMDEHTARLVAAVSPTANNSGTTTAHSSTGSQQAKTKQAKEEKTTTISGSAANNTVSAEETAKSLNNLVPVSTFEPTVTSWSPLIFEAIKPVSTKFSSVNSSFDTQSYQSTAAMNTNPTNNLRVSKSLESLYKSLEGKIGLEKELRDIAFGNSNSNNNATTSNINENEGVSSSLQLQEENNSNNTNNDVLPAIPRSFEEIYRLSGKLRSKKQQQSQQSTTNHASASNTSNNNNNKRDHDAMILAQLPREEDDSDYDSDDAEDDGDLHSFLVKQGLAKKDGNKKPNNSNSNSSTSAASNSSHTNEGSNTSNNAAAAGENRELVEQTLAMAKEIGWLTSESDVQAIRDEHYRVLAAQQSSLATNNSNNSNANNSSSNAVAPALTSSAEFPSLSTAEHTKQTKPRGHSPSVNTNTQNNSNNSNNNSRNNSAGRRPPASSAVQQPMKSYEYPLQAVMGALPAGAEGNTNTARTLAQQNNAAANRYGGNNNNSNNNNQKNNKNSNSSNNGNGTSASWRPATNNPYFGKK